MKNKLSALDEIRLEKKRLRNECAEYEQKLYDNWDYAKGNFGRLAIGSVISSVQNGLASLFSIFTGKKNKSEEEEEQEQTEHHTPSMATQMFMGAAPFLWEMVQPMIVGMVMKKAKTMFSGEGKKKTKKVVKKAKASDLD